MANVAQRRIRGAVLNPAIIRLVGGAAVLAIYSSVLPTAPDAKDSATSEQWASLSRDAYAAGQFDRALAPTLELTKAYPQQHIYFERLAIIYQRLGRRAEEAAAWEAAVNLSPTPVEDCPALPDAYVAIGNVDKARDAFERCARFEPGNSDMRFFLGRFHERAGHADLAASTYQQAVDSDPRHGDSQLGLARLELRAGRLDTAEHAARAVLQTDDDNADALLVAGLAAQRQGRGADARRDLSKALKVAADYVDVHIALGILDFSEARVDDARRHFRRAADLDPGRRAELDVWLKRVGDGS